MTAAHELALEDESFRTELPQLEALRDELAERLQHLLVPKDANDLKDVILEIKAGEGGEESALFAGDLLRMYLRYAERHGWRTEVLDAVDSDLGGYKDVTVAVRAWRRGRLEPAEVRRWRAPRPARSGDRITGAHPHQRRGSARLP